jgi:hypothetical protein
MAINASIPLGVQPLEVQSPVNAFAKMQQLQGMQQQNAMNALAMQEKQRAIADEANLNRIYGQSYDPEGKLDKTTLFRGMAGANLGSKIPAVQKMLSDQEKSALETRKLHLENASKIVNGVASIARNVRNQEQWDAAKMQIADQFGQEVADRLPPMYNPLEIERRVQAASTVDAQIQQEQQKLNYQLNLDKFSYQQKHDNASLALQKRGQDLTNARALEHIQVQRENAGQGKNPTEDERKAAGWLSSAIDAYNNMADAVTEKKDANEPGYLEAMASSVGMEGAANAFRSSSRQKFYTAASALSEAALRAATGAGYNMTEYRNTINRFTPTLTDSNEVLRQKLSSARRFIESLRPRAGRALNSMNLPELKPMPGVDDVDEKGLPNAPGGMFADNPFNGTNKNTPPFVNSISPKLQSEVDKAMTLYKTRSP